MHNGIPWWLALVLEAIVNWEVTVAVVFLLAAIALACWRTRRSKGRRNG